MELKPKNEKLIYAMKKRTEYLRLAFVSAVLLIMTLFILITGRYPITVLAISICCIYEIVTCFKFYNKNKERITDISDSQICLEEDYFSCFQASQNAYENCDILIGEIETLIEDTKGVGFYIVLGEDANLSTIMVDNVRTERNMFYVDGYAYDEGEFVEIFEQLSIRTNADIEATKTHNAWLKEEEKNFLKILYPWLLVNCIGLIHLAITLFIGA